MITRRGIVAHEATGVAIATGEGGMCQPLCNSVIHLDWQILTVSRRLPLQIIPKATNC